MLWDGDLSQLSRSDVQRVVQEMPEEAMIMDRRGLRALGVPL